VKQYISPSGKYKRMLKKAVFWHNKLPGRGLSAKLFRFNEILE